MKAQSSRSVLALVPNSNSRETLRKTLNTAKFQISFISGLSEVNSAIVAFKPAIFVHDWKAVEESQSRKFHYQAMSNLIFNNVPRIILVPSVSANILGFASDVLIDRVMTYGSALLNLPMEIEMILESQRNGFEIKNLIRELRSDQYVYDQSEIDRKVLAAFRRFPHDQHVQIEYGNYLVRQGDLLAARDLVKQVMYSNPSNLRASNLLARIFMKQGHWDQAIATLNKSDGLSPSNPDRILLLADAHYGKGEYDQAMTLYEQAKTLDRGVQRRADEGLGKIKLAQGELEEALNLLSQSLSEEEAASYFNNSAVLSVKQGQLEQALKLYQTALRTLRTDKLKPTIFNNIALTYRRLGQVGEAEKYLKKALRIDEQNPKTLAQIQQLKDQKK